VRKSAPRVSGERKKEESQKIKIRTMSFQAKAQADKKKKQKKKTALGKQTSLFFRIKPKKERI